MTKKTRGHFLLGGLLAAGLFGGCENDIDSDSLVRELRILSMRAGAPDPGSAADVLAEVKPGPSGLDLVFTTDHVDLSAMVGAPTGSGRRITAERPLVYEWYLCVGPASLFNPGTLDPGCRKWLPSDVEPKQNPALRFVGSGETLALQTAILKEVVGSALQIMLTGSSSGSGGGGTAKLPEKPVSILLPVLVRVRVTPEDRTNPLDSEVGVSYLRTWIALPGMTLPLANHNPVLVDVVAGPEKDGNKTPLVPCWKAPCPLNQVKRGQDLHLIGASRAGSAENYTPQDDTGRGERPETLRYSWFATDGNFERERTGDSQPENLWNSDSKRPPPAETTQATLWLVVQDERGGNDARRYELAWSK